MTINRHTLNVLLNDGADVETALFIYNHLGGISSLESLSRAIDGDRVDGRLMSLLTQLRAHSTEGYAYCEVWGRDCDGVEATDLVRIPATLEAYRKLEQDVYENAEGPYSVTILPQEWVERWQPVFYDHYAEQMGY